MYRARDEDGRAVILKVPGGDHPSPGDLARIRREYRILRDLDCPGVVGALGLRRSGGTWTLILEDVPGESLERALERGPMPVVEALDVTLRVAEILGCVHARGILHRDVNPSNIVRDPDSGRVVLVDWGIATPAWGGPRAAEVPERLEGTLAFMAPEQTGRTGRPVDDRSDLYSLGCTLYALLLGRGPFEAGDPMEMAYAHLARRAVPPTRRDPSVPSQVSRVVTKLLRKAAEERYQSAHGLAADLRRCLDDLRRTGAVAEFALGAHDVRQTLEVSRRLVGRSEEVTLLRESFERVAHGRSRLVLVAGSPGIGKTVLVRQLYRPLTRLRGRFAVGKFDQYQRDVPYSAIVAALRSLVRQIAASEESALERWRERLRAAVRPNGSVLLRVLPEAEWLVGPQPDVQELGPAEARHRLWLVFRRFLRALCGAEGPLVLFVDDLQWADPASLALLEALLADEDLPHLLVVGAFRDEDVGPGHPLRVVVESLRKVGVPIRRIDLGPLSLHDVVSLVAHTVRRDREEVRGLAGLVHHKTGGNPFFVNRFLETLERKGDLWFDTEAGRWRWDLARIRREDITDNVVELLVEHLEELPPATRESLAVAALLGGRFDLGLVARTRGVSTPKAYADLLPALREQAVLELTAPVPADADDPEAPLVVDRFRFAHDRIQQAAAALVVEEDRPATHLRIGRLLREAFEEGSRRGPSLFDVVSQLDAGRSRMSDPAERLDLARLNLEAGRRSRASQAYAAAAGYLAVAMECLPDDAWESAPRLALDIHAARVDAESAAGSFEVAEDLALRTLERVEDPLDRIPLYQVLVRQYGLEGRYEESARVASEGLGLLGIRLPTSDLDAAIAGELERLRGSLGDRPLASLLDAPATEDEEAAAAHMLLIALGPSAAFIDQRLVLLVGLVSVNLSLERGMQVHSIPGFATYGMLLCRLGDYAGGCEAAQLALGLSERFGDLFYRSLVADLTGAFIMVWSRPLDEALPVLQEAMRACEESGNVAWAAFPLENELLQLLFGGESLDAILEVADPFIAYAEATHNVMAVDSMVAVRLVARNLAGRTPGRDVFEDGLYESGEAFMAACRERRSHHAVAMFLIDRAETRVIHGQPEAALEDLAEAAPLLDFLLGSPVVAKHVLCEALATADVCVKRPAAERGPLLERVEALRETVARWAESCPSTFLHKLLLVDADLARLRGDLLEAVDLYDAAAEEAREQGFTHLEALAAERAAALWLARDKPRIARGYLEDARRVYRLWGAARKVADLEARHEGLGPVEVAPPAPADSMATLSVSSGALLDATSVTKASESIAGRLDLEDVLAALMRVTMENAGARSGALFWPDEDEPERLVVAVEADGTEGRERVLPGATLEDWAGPRSVARFVRRTGEAIVSGDLARDPRFMGDPHVDEGPTASVLCIPVTHRGELRGVLYLANDLARDAFTREQVELLRILAGQIAISLENARLYEAAKRENAARRELEAIQRGGTRMLARLTSGRSLDQMLSDLAETVEDVRPGLLACVLVLEPDGDRVRVAAAPSLPAEYREGLEAMPLGEEPCACLEAVTTGRRAITADVRTDARWEEHLPALDRAGLRAAWSEPIVGTGRRLLGAVTVYAREPRRPQAWDLELLETAARLAGIAIERSAREAARREMEAQMEAAQKLESLGMLASGVAHDFKNLLGGIRGHASLALEEAQGTVREHVERVEDISVRAADLCEQLLAYAGRRERVVEHLSVTRLVDEMSRLLETSIGPRVHLDRRLAPDLPPVEGDATQLRQVVLNLILNASDAIGDEEGTIVVKTGRTRCDRACLRGTLLAEDLPEGEYVFLEVSDTGGGMDADTLAHIFDPFFTTKEDGHGLGLAAVLGIVRAHEGTIEAGSVPGRGSRIRILFPARGEAALAEDGAEVEAAPPRRFEGLALVADDDRVISYMATHMLQRLGFDTLTVSDGREAVAVFDQHADDVALVVLDKHMPGLPGAEILASIRRRRPDVPVLLASGDVWKEDTGPYGTVDTPTASIRKPYSLEELRRSLDSLIPA
ncbi:MAG: AAA family ATPase [Myxococcota bacterium]